MGSLMLLSQSSSNIRKGVRFNRTYYIRMIGVINVSDGIGVETCKNDFLAYITIVWLKNIHNIHATI